MKKKRIKRTTIRRLSKTWIGFILVVLLVGYQYYCDNLPIEAGERFEVSLVEVVDGDTAWFTVNGEATKVRFLYIDTPEATSTIEEYGEEATNYVFQRLVNADTIELELNVDGDQYDKYNRLLAWVFVDGDLLQKDIALQGYVKRFYDYGYEYTYKEIIIEADNEAKYNKVGIYQ